MYTQQVCSLVFQQNKRLNWRPRVSCKSKGDSSGRPSINAALSSIFHTRFSFRPKTEVGSFESFKTSTEGLELECLLLVRYCRNHALRQSACVVGLRAGMKQVSTMSVFEQYSAGVPLLFPTKRFCHELMSNHDRSSAIGSAATSSQDAVAALHLVSRFWQGVHESARPFGSHVWRLPPPLARALCPSLAVLRSCSLAHGLNRNLQEPTVHLSSSSRSKMPMKNSRCLPCPLACLPCLPFSSPPSACCYSCARSLSLFSTCQELQAHIIHMH